MEEIRLAVSIGFIAVFAIFDVFNKRRIPILVLLAFFTFAFGINVLDQESDLFSHKIELACGFALFLLAISLNTDKEVGRADLMAWGALIVAFPEASFLMLAFLCSASFTALMVLFNMLFLKLGWNETIRRGVPYFPAMLIGLFAALSSRLM